MRSRTAKAVVTILALAGLFAFASVAPAATYVVRPNGSGDYATIQDAIDAVVDTDIIELADGTFDGTGNRDLDLLGKAITIRSQSGDPEVCTIDCGGNEFDPHRGFWFHSGEVASSVVQDISVVNGYLVDANGGAVFCEGASPTFDGCVFGANTVDGAGVKGGALYCTGISSPVIDGCRFIGNAAGGSSDGMGGAMAFENGVDAAIYNTVVDGNYCGHLGGGIYVDSSGLSMSGCTIADNGASAGAGLSTQGGTFIITGCSFLWNEATGTGHGGGILASQGTYMIANCSIMGNAAWGGNGGGIYFSHDATGEVTNTAVVWSQMGGGIYVDAAGRETPTISCCDVFENSGGNYTGNIADQTGISDNISEDPQFCDAPSGDLTLYNTSPCAAANSPCGQLIGAEDVDCFTAVEPSSWGKIKSSFE